MTVTGANRYDLIVVGGGIVGLWVARFAIKAGMRVAIVDRGAFGSGASATTLGALLPHLPGRSKPANAFQYAALLELGDLVADLEDATGVTTGFARCGRVMPIRNNGFLGRAKKATEFSSEEWSTAETGFAVDVIDQGEHSDWLDPSAAPLGVVCDNLSARISPSDYIAALKAAMPTAAVIEGVDLTGFDVIGGRVYTRNGDIDLRAERIVLAAGFCSFDLARDRLGVDLGHGVKGQAAMFHIPPARGRPVIYDNGVYIVARDNGHCAVGSTSENDWSGQHDTEPEKIADVIARAKTLCPALRDARPVGLWAGVRPRCHARDPIVGALDTDRRVFIATGGFKISFGIAHRLAKCLMEDVLGADDRTPIPETFTTAHHFAEAGRRARQTTVPNVASGAVTAKP